MISIAPPAGLVLKSGGSSGKVKTVFHSWDAVLKVMTLGARGVRSGSAEPIRRIANCLSAGNLWGGYIFGQGVAEALGALVFPLGSSLSGADFREVVESYNIDTVMGMPSLLDLALGEPDSTPLGSLKTVLYVGEKFTDQQVARVMSANPGLSIRSLAYSTNETGPIGYQCRFQSGSLHHIHDDAVVLEILDPASNAPTKIGDAGEVVVTPLGTSTMPLVRYRMGDIARFVSGACPCGSRTQVIELLGRAEVVVKVFGVPLRRDHLLSLLRPDIDAQPEEIQVVLTRGRGSGYPMLRILIDSSAATEDAAGLAFRRLRYDKDFIALNIQVPDLEIAIERIARSEFRKAPGSGKRPFFVDEQV